MQKNYRSILILVICIATNINGFGQADTAKYKDVVLDGKPAKLNVATGEIKVINLEAKKEQQPSGVVETLKPEAVALTKPEIVYSNPIESDYHVVQKGENLLKLSERYNVSLRDLKNANNLETTLIQQGQKLRVKNLEAKSYTNNSTSKVENVNTYKTISNRSDVHLVKKGETLYGLSKLYGMSVSKLKQKNKLTSNLIKIGQTLNISDFDTFNKDALMWTVSKGDTLYSIARKNGTTVNAIKELNGLTSNLISIGQKLQLK